MRRQCTLPVTPTTSAPTAPASTRESGEEGSSREAKSGSAGRHVPRPSQRACRSQVDAANASHPTSRSAARPPAVTAAAPFPPGRRAWTSAAPAARPCTGSWWSRVSPATTRWPAGRRRPPPSLARSAAHAWLEPLMARAEEAGPLCALELDVQGIHCAACVWLMNELFRRQPGGAGLTVNPALGKVAPPWTSAAPSTWGLPAARWRRFGYLFGPSRKRPDGGLAGSAAPPRHLRRPHHERDAVLHQLLRGADAGGR